MLAHSTEVETPTTQPEELVIELGEVNDHPQELELPVEPEPMPLVEQKTALETKPTVIKEIEPPTAASEDAVALVEKYSEMYGVDPTLAKAIIKCESGIRSTGLNDIQEYQRTIKTQVPNVVSSASGYFQFLDSTWKYTMERMGLPTATNKHDPVVSIQAGVFLLSTDGSRHWNESRGCWFNKI